MSTSTRRRLGVWVAVLAVAALPALAFVGVPLVTMGSAYFVDTGATTSSVHMHWPLTVVAVVFVSGIALVVSPRRSDRA